MPYLNKNISLKWKFALILISVLLLLHSIFSFFIYIGIAESYNEHRTDLRSNHINIAKALVSDSFSVLEQISEAIAQIPNIFEQKQLNAPQQINQLNKNWHQWQMSWGLENIALFDNNGNLVNYWGEDFKLDKERLLSVINQETPNMDIICPNLCYQNVIIPVLDKAGQTGALSVTRSLVDIIIEHWTTTKTDLGVLVVDETQIRWPFKLSAMSNASRNQSIFKQIIKDHDFEGLFENIRIISKNGRNYEVTIFPVRKTNKKIPPYFLLIEDVTEAQKKLNSEYQKLWWYGGISLIVSLGLVLWLLHFSLSRITRLSSALPLLAQHRYNQFRSLLKPAASFLFGYDELDRLNSTALELTDQLELLENEVQTNTQLLTKKSHELASERDFINQLVETAPIIIITQNHVGSIISVNETGVKEFELTQQQLTGRKFDDFLPESENEHINKLERLRSGSSTGNFQIDGLIITPSGNNSHISWLHSLMKPKSVNNETLILTIGIDVSERKIAEEQTHWMATHDQLTGLSNRRFFQEEFNHMLSVAERYGEKIALFYLDLDQFKSINDTSGHQAGDNLLQLVASALSQTVRDSDVLSRIGGDEFTLIVAKARYEGVVSLAKKINLALSSIDFHFEGKKYRISCSVGISIYPEHGTSANELLSNADLAMYKAKESGRGQYHVFTPGKEYQQRLSKRRHWKDLIENAIAEERFILFFQPIQDLNNNSISHYECLIRLVLSDGQIMMPGDFIGVAETMGLIGKIDRIVIKLAVQQHLKFQKQNRNASLAINLSGFSFNDLTIFSDFAKLLEQPGVDPSKLIFEITETSAVSNFNAAQSLIKMIKSVGCRLALDDFGVGFSSFYYLKHLPVEYIKIDGSFIHQIDKNDEDKIFVKAITEVSQSLGKKTIAEFVENEETLKIVKELGVDYAQGYFIGRPDRLE